MINQEYIKHTTQAVTRALCSVYEDLGDIVYHTQKGTEYTHFNVWKKLNEPTK